MQAVERDSSTSPEIQTLNRRFLRERRVQLQALLQQRIDALKKYQAAVNASISAEERKVIEESIREAEVDLRALENDLKADSSALSTASAPPPETAPAMARVSNINEARAEALVMPSVVSTDSLPALTRLPASAVVQTCDGSSNSYTNAPSLLTDVVDRIAETIVTSDQTPDATISTTFNRMLFYTVADAVAPASTTLTAQSIRSLKPYQYLGETARTDKQIGAPPKSSGSTSAIEKPGFARLLGLAVENGAILQEVNGTTLTLSTSPYVLYTLNGGDTAENYQRAGFLNRVGVFANFKISNEDNALGSARRNQLEQWSIKARLFGDRSTRTKDFQQFWFNEIQPVIEERLIALNTVNLFFDDTRFAALTGTEDGLHTQLNALLKTAGYLSKDDAGKKEAIKNLVLCYLKGNLYDPIKGGTINLVPADRDQINNEYVTALGKALGNLEVVRELLDKKLDDLNKSPLGTFAYVNHRQAMGSDYSEGKFLFEQDMSAFRPLKLVANLAASFYHNPNRMMNQQTARDITAALSFEGKVNSPFLKGTVDLSKVTFAFTGSYQRTFENKRVAGRKADIASAQFKLDVPIFAGVSFPLSFTYSNATETQKKNFFRANFGLNFDMDKLIAITNLLGK